MDEGELVSMMTKSIGIRSRSPYGVALSELLTKEDLSWQALPSRLLHEYSSQKATKLAIYAYKESAPRASSSTNKTMKKKKKYSNEIIWLYCNKKGHFLGDYY